MPKRKPNRVIETIGSAMELPPGMMGRGAHIELSSNREAVIDGCCSVLQLDDDMIKINTGDSIIKFMGRGLEIKSLTGTGAVIKGYIICLEFSN